jgi:type I restriction enzyme M protein
VVAAQPASGGPKVPRQRSSEFRAYPWIQDQLRDSGWDTRNPNLHPRGEVWTQGECLSNEEIRRGLGQQKPENVAIINDRAFWVIEAKEGSRNLNIAVAEAKAYAGAIASNSTNLSVPFATGVAGDEKAGFDVRTEYLGADGRWDTVTAGAHPLRRLPSKAELRRIMMNNNSDLQAVPVTVREIIELSKYINDRFHIAKIERDQRAVVVALLLLALQQDPTISHVAGQGSIFIEDVNARARRVFDQAGRREIWETVRLRPSNENVELQAQALSDVVTRLRAADILHAAQTADVLGQFFESFLRYGNTSKDLGIVLTPRHLCWFAAEAVDVRRDDIVYDPAAGTGGFLVAAFNRVKESATAGHATKFAQENLYGVEVSGKIATLAFINMFFRGDGKHNLKIDSALLHRLVTQTTSSSLPQFRDRPRRRPQESAGVTKVLMNPPFGLKDLSEQEPHFIDHALYQMTNNGILFSVLPASVLYDRKWSRWRSRLLEDNTLAAVVSFPVDIFYPVATESVGIFVRKGVPHSIDREVLWARIIDDGFVKRKGFRVERRNGDYRDTLRPLASCIRSWLSGEIRGSDRLGELEWSPLASGELLPQAHLGTGEPDPRLFANEVRSVYKEVMTQIWDQQQVQERGHDRD